MKAIYQRAFQRISQKLTPSYLSSLNHHNASIYHMLPRDDLRCLLKIHCKLIKPPSQESQLIEIGKRLRASIQASEAKICQQCPSKENCKVSFLPGEVAESRAVDDLVQFLERLNEEEVDEKPRIYVAGFKILTALPEIIEILKNDEGFVKEFDVERLKLSEERVKKDEENETKRGDGKEKEGKAEYRKERFTDTEEVRKVREDRRSVGNSSQLFEDKGLDDAPRRERNDGKQRWNQRERDNTYDRRNNKFEGRDNRYNNDRDNKYERRNKSEGDWNDRRGSENRGGYQRGDQEVGKREYKRNDYERNDRNDRGSYRERTDRNDRDYGNERNNKFEKRESNYDRQNTNRYPRQERQQGNYQRNNNNRFNEDRPQKRQYERAPRKTMNDLYQSADFQNKSFERGFNKEAEGSVNRRPIPNENDLSAFEGSFNPESDGRQGRRVSRGGRGSRQE